MKSGLGLRPVFHWAPHRLHAHVAITVLALLLERMAEYELSGSGQIEEAARTDSGDLFYLVRFNRWRPGGPLRRPVRTVFVIVDVQALVLGVEHPHGFGEPDAVLLPISEVLVRIPLEVHACIIGQ